MSYVVLARRFRPQKFEEVVGQEHVAATLRNAVTGGRLAHAYLFSGPRGVGKTSMARILAKALNCHGAQNPTADPCGKCPSCTEIADGRALDVIEMDAASHTGVDDVRDLRAGALYSTARDRFKVYIIDEAHMMSRSAFNALLKTLEEPPAHVKFVFATTEPERLPDTIQSRCQRFDFRRISTADIRRRLEQIAGSEKLNLEPEALGTIARHSRGGLRDAEGLLDQLIAMRGGEKIAQADVLALLGAVSDEETGNLLGALGAGRPGEALVALGRCLDAGAELDEVAAALADRVRGALLLAAGGPEAALVSGDYAHVLDQLKVEAERFGVENLVRMGSILAEARRLLRASPDPRLVLELALVRLARLPDLADLRELVEQLERQGGGAPAAPAAPAPRPIPLAAVTPEGFSPPSAAPQASAGQDLAGKWAAIRAAVAAQHEPTNRLLERCRPVAAEAERLILEMDESARFTFEQLDRPEKRQLLETAAAEALGRKVRIAFRLGGEFQPEPRAAAAPAPAPGARPPAQSRAAKPTPADPAVNKLLDSFGGHVIDIRKKKP